MNENFLNKCVYFEITEENKIGERIMSFDLKQSYDLISDFSTILAFAKVNKISNCAVIFANSDNIKRLMTLKITGHIGELRNFKINKKTQIIKQEKSRYEMTVYKDYFNRGQNE